MHKEAKIDENQVFLKYKKMKKYGFSSKRRIKPHTT